MIRIDFFDEATKDWYYQLISPEIKARLKVKENEPLYKFITKDGAYDLDDTLKILLIEPKEKVLKNATFARYIDDKGNAPCKKQIENVFCYDLIASSVKKKLKCSTDANNRYKALKTARHKIISSLNGVVCPYCNRQYITTWKPEKGEHRTTADLDHYYNKSDYPLFSLSLFNFIPSCQICNSRMKGQKTDRTLYPYEEGFGDDARFAIEPKDKKKEIDVWLGNKNAEFDIKIEISDSVNADKKIRIENSKKVFGLEKVYQAHKEYVRELIIKKRVYDEGSYSDNMAVIFEKLGLDYSEAELQRFLYGSVSPDSDRPLSKLTCDIIKK